MSPKKYSRQDKKITSLYSVTDWSYHKGRVTWDDFFDKEGNFVATIATMEMAKEDGYLSDKAIGNKEPFPERIFIQEKDKTWAIYEDLKYFTPERVQELLNDLGGLIGEKFVFKYKVIPKWQEQWIREMEKKTQETTCLKRIL